jgi:quinol monooxygenase YgiN
VTRNRGLPAAIGCVVAAMWSSLAFCGEASPMIDKAGGLFVMATFKVKPGQETKFLEIMKRVVIDTRREEGNVDYRLHKMTSAPDTYVTYEVFTDKAAADAHNASDHIKQIVPPLLATLDGEISVQTLDIIR